MHFVPTRPEIENFKKLEKEFKKLINTIMASFHGKIGWKRLRKRENKIIIPFLSCPTRNRKLQKNRKKIQKIQKYHYSFFSSQNMLEKSEKEKKWIISFRFVPTQPEIENSKNVAKKFKKLKNSITASFQVKTGWKRLRNKENKN